MAAAGQQRGTETEDQAATGHQFVDEKASTVAGACAADGQEQNNTAGDDLDGRGKKEAGTTKNHVATDN